VRGSSFPLNLPFSPVGEKEFYFPLPIGERDRVRGSSFPLNLPFSPKGRRNSIFLYPSGRGIG